MNRRGNAWMHGTPLNRPAPRGRRSNAWVSAVFLLGGCAVAPAGAPVPASRGGDLPPVRWVVGGSKSSEYVISDTGSRGRALTLERRVMTAASASEFGTTGSMMDASGYRNRRVRLRASIRADSIAGGGSTWLRIDNTIGGMLALENNMSRAVRGTTGWVEQTTTLDVPANAKSIVFGLLLTGGGALHARDLRIEVVEVPAVNAPVSAAAREVLDSALAIARANSLWRDTVHWDALKTRLEGKLAGAVAREDAYPAIRDLVAALGDHHSGFYPPVDGAPTDNPLEAMQPPREPDIEGRSLEGGRLAHVTVPAHAGQSMDASRRYVVNARRLLVGQADGRRCGWVVDLRANGGGNMWPMLAALAPLLGSDTLGAFVSHGAATRWTSAGAQGDGGAMREYAVGAPGATLDLRAFPVAVLTGPRTASSGEAVTLAFRGRPFTRSFGAPTAGVSTANAPFPLPGGGLLNLTTARMADRTGRIFGDAIEPDEAVPGDAALDAATRWLLAQSRCSAP